MTTNSRVKPDRPTAEETRSGSYFVSNYPPYACWTDQGSSEFHLQLDQPAQKDVPLGIYVHIPFCRLRCKFCYFKIFTGKNSKEIQRYLDGTLRELELYAKSPIVGRRKPRFVYFGGGTPSYLSSRQLAGLASRMQALLAWDEAEEVAFECEPGTLTEPKLRAIRDFGVTRLSLGVEHFDDEILSLNGRAHLSKEIFRAYEFARSINFPQINIDLIAGMMGETWEKWRSCVEQALALQPDSVTLYQMELPHNTSISREMRDRGEAAGPVADWQTKRDWVEYGFEQFEKLGYTVIDGYTAVRDPERTRFVYRELLWRGADMIGVGNSAIGHMGGTHYQNEASFEGYLEKIENGRLPVWRTFQLNRQELLIRELILQLKFGQVSRSYFQNKFDVDIQSRFAEPIVRLQETGLLEARGGDLTLTREGLLRVDGLLPQFFLPQHLS